MTSRPPSLADGPMMPPPPSPWAGRGGWRRWWLPALLGVSAAVLVAAHRPLLTGFASLFRVNDPAPADAMLVLTPWADSPARVYQRGWAPEILLVPRGEVPFPDLNPFVVESQLLIRNGVPAVAIRALPPVGLGADYAEIAAAVRDDLREHPIRRLIVAVSAAESARVRRVFRRTLRGSGVDIRMLAVGNPRYDESSWYRRDEGLVKYFGESLEVIKDALVP